MDSTYGLAILGAIATLGLVLPTAAVGTRVLLTIGEHRSGHAEVGPRAARWIRRCARTLAWMPSAFLVGFALLIAQV